MEENFNDIYKRTCLLLGEEAMNCIKSAKVILFGVGGVGSWCVESLVRTGVGHLTIVDSDNICATNINRQLPATTKTIGKVKVDVIKQRMQEINPEVTINAIQQIYNKETSSSFHLDSYDYMIDAIDSLENKVHLLQTATKTNVVVFSSMGAALKSDPSKIKVAEFWKVKGCPLAAALRRKMKKYGMPQKKIQCVYSEELLQNRGADGYTENDPQTYKKAQVNGTLAHITAIFGFTLAGLVISDIIGKVNSGK